MGGTIRPNRFAANTVSMVLTLTCIIVCGSRFVAADDEPPDATTDSAARSAETQTPEAKTETPEGKNKSENDGRIYEDKTRRFRLTIPSGWSATPASYSVMHYRDVFLCINNRGDKALRVIDKRDDSGKPYWWDWVAEQLEPGSVYLDFAVWDGPIHSIAPEFGSHTVGTKSRPFSGEFHHNTFADGKLTVIEISFIKDKQEWNLYAYMRNPVEDSERAKAEEMLRSFQFLDVPERPRREPASESQARAVAEIEKLQGKVYFDETVTDKPVVKVNLRSTLISDADLAHLEEFKNLEDVDFFNTSVTDEGFVHLKGLTNLQRLHLDATQVTGAGAVHLREAKKLHTLSLADTQVTDRGLEVIKELPSLRNLNLFRTKITDEGLVHLKELTTLKELTLGFSEVTDGGLVHLRAMTGLRSLGLGYSQVSDAGLEHIKTLTDLEELWLYNTQVTDAGVVHLKGLANLHGLNLSNTQVTDAGLVHLRGLQKLRALDLGNTAVSDAGLGHIKDLTNLQYLDLDLTKLTDAGLRQLKGMKRLRTLRISRTLVSDRGVREIRAALPKCIVGN
jgi:internalin A